ncbi:MAG: LON peptidase substrate-binding domain-containing protein, partial [Planctomycetes bacterium]|nr:LON peptidase substrate-binding domain-containing protein [Planctomycetota bacterium]
MDDPKSRPASRRIAPLFPLPDFILYPGTVQPLRIFEPRYLQMVETLLDSPGLLVMGTVLGENKRDLGASDACVEPIGTLAQLLGYERLDSGEFLISVLGLVRVHHSECLPDPSGERLYREVSIDVVDAETDPRVEEQLRPSLQEALQSRWSSES